MTETQLSSPQGGGIGDVSGGPQWNDGSYEQEGIAGVTS